MVGAVVMNCFTELSYSGWCSCLDPIVPLVGLDNEIPSRSIFPSFALKNFNFLSGIMPMAKCMLIWIKVCKLNFDSLLPFQIEFEGKNWIRKVPS